MFRKNLSCELKQYLRWLWPFMLGAVGTGALTSLIIFLDRNPIEATGSVMGIALFVFAAFALVARVFVQAFISFFRGISSKRAEYSQSPVQFLAVKYLTFIIFTVISTLLIVAGISMFAWDIIWQKFAAFSTEWQYFLEFFFFMLIVPTTVYFIPVTMGALFRFCQKKWLRVISMIVGIIILFFAEGLFAMEISLLIHSDSSDMEFLWTATFIFFVFCMIGIVGSILLTGHLLKKQCGVNKLAVESAE